MAQRTEYVCDVCGEVKKESNHWFGMLVVQILGMTLIHPFGSHVTMSYEGQPVSTTPSTLHLCGQECVQKKQAEVMDAYLRMHTEQAPELPTVEEARRAKGM